MHSYPFRSSQLAFCSSYMQQHLKSMHWILALMYKHFQRFFLVYSDSELTRKNYRAVKMAAGAIRVCVLEGIYAKMTDLGLPLSLAVELQYRVLRLDSSLWTARLSNGGYSAVSLFRPLQRRRPRCRRQRRKPKPSHQPISSLTFWRNCGKFVCSKRHYYKPLTPHFSIKSTPWDQNCKLPGRQ